MLVAGTGSSGRWPWSRCWLSTKVSSTCFVCSAGNRLVWWISGTFYIGIPPDINFSICFFPDILFLFCLFSRKQFEGSDIRHFLIPVSHWISSSFSAIRPIIKAECPVVKGLAHLIYYLSLICIFAWLFQCLWICVMVVAWISTKVSRIRSKLWHFLCRLFSNAVVLIYWCKS